MKVRSGGDAEPSPEAAVVGSHAESEGGARAEADDGAREDSVVEEGAAGPLAAGDIETTAPESVGVEDDPHGGGEADEADEPDDEGPSVDAPASRRRFAPALLVVGLLAALFVGRQALPTTRAVVVRLDGERSDVRAIALSVGPVADGEEAISSVEWRYEATAPPPPAVRTEVKLPNGEHRFRVEIVRSTGERTETARVVKVADDEVTIRAQTH